MLTLGRAAGNDNVLEEKIGPVDAASSLRRRPRPRQLFVPALRSEDGAAASREAIAAALGLAIDDIGFDGLRPSRWSIGNTFTLVPLRSIEAVRRCHIHDGAWDAAFEANGPAGAFVFCRQTDAGATTSMPACSRRRLASGRSRHRLGGGGVRRIPRKTLALGNGEHRFLIVQGFEMARPSLIEFGVTMRYGALASASVGGPAIIVTGHHRGVMRSLLFVPADSAKKLDKAMTSGADALIVDLEDLIVHDGKAKARESAAAFLKDAMAAASRPYILVRVNGLQTGLIDADLDAVVPAKPDAIMLPKAEGGASVVHTDAKLAVREAMAGLPDGHVKVSALATETAASLFVTGTFAGSSAPSPA